MASPASCRCGPVRVSAVWIAEIFASIQGEGRFSGTRSVFVRTSGCNLRCHFCDTPYTSWKPTGETRSWQDVLNEVTKFDCEHVVLTGGEPLLQADLVPLSQALTAAGHVVTVETAGTVDRPVAAALMSISPKFSNSDPLGNERWLERHRRDRHQPAVVGELISRYDYQLKFVVDTPADIDEILAYLGELPDYNTANVWLMPQGVQQADLAARGVWLEPLAEELGFQFCPRRHIEMFGNVRGT